MGGDGRISSINRFTARDAIGLTLNYFGNDFTAINGQPFPGYSAFLPTGDYRPLYNGNISSSSVYQKKFDYYNSPGGPLIFYNYSYDQLNRLTGQDAYNGFSVDSNHWQNMAVMGANLKERIAYDGNGNILKCLRKSITGGHMDSLNYSYYANTNQLKRITDSMPPNTYTSQQDNLILDIDNQPNNNYSYDAIGNLIKDSLEQITAIKWNVYGKIQEISRVATTEVPVTNIKYSYDALGNRISQVVTTTDNKYYTWYVRDAQGNILSTYTAEGDEDLEDLNLKHSENFLYGSSRLQRAGKLIGELKDLKPNNPEAIAKGFEQLERCAQVLSKMPQYKGVTEFVGMVETYSVVGMVLTQNLSFTYTVQKGDNLTSISNKFGISVEEVKKLNGMTNDKVQTGNKIVIGNVSTSLDMEDKDQHKKDVNDYKRYINSGEYMLDRNTQKEQYKKVN